MVGTGVADHRIDQVGTDRQHCAVLSLERSRQQTTVCRYSGDRVGGQHRDQHRAGEHSAAAAPTAVTSGSSGVIEAGVVGSGLTSTAPVASANTVSPSSGVWHGWMVRASPSWAATATRRQAALLSAASVATTAMVVLSGLSSPCRSV